MRAFVLVLLCGVVSQVPATRQSGSQAADQRFGASTTAIVVAVVVRDGAGKPITGLGTQDFQLFEDGELQQIGDATAVTAHAGEGSGRAGSAPAGVAPSANGPSDVRPTVPPVTPSFVAVVVDRVSPEARAAVYRGASQWIDKLGSNDFVAVYVSDLSLSTVQSYTNDRDKLRRAVKEATSRTTSVFDETATRALTKSSSEGDARSSVPVVASAESVGRPVDVRGDSAGGLERITRNSWEALARDQQGYAATNALLAVTTALGALPGRKSVLFVAEGLAIPDAVLPKFQNVILTANRSNVSIYTVDAAGLRVHSKESETGRQVRAMGAAGISVGADGSNQSSLGMMEQNEDALRKSPRVSLTLLAQETGGLFTDNANDLGKAFRSFDADRSFYYLLTYVPKRLNFEGEWRRISVKVLRPRAQVAARSGYLAVRSGATVPLLAYEGGAIAALERATAPEEFQIRCSSLIFPSTIAPRVVAMASVDAVNVTFAIENAAYRSDVSVVARLITPNGEIAHKSSQLFRLAGALDQIDKARTTQMLFIREAAVAPGPYVLEVAIHDAIGRRSSVHRSPLTIPAPANGLQVSSLVLIDRVDRAPAGVGRDNPLQVGQTMLYPFIGKTAQGKRQTPLTFYFVVLPGSGPSVQANLEVLRQTEVIAQAPVGMASDPSGQSVALGQLPIETLKPGLYVLRLVVVQGAARVEREVSVEVLDR